MVPTTQREVSESLYTANSFLEYRDFALAKYVEYRRERIGASKNDYSCLVAHLEKVAECICLNGILTGYIGEVGLSFTESEARAAGLEFDPTASGSAAALQPRVHSILNQIVREWSAEGEMERQESFGVICKELAQRFPPSTRQKTRVLVPGSGLGRLPFDLAMMGFSTTANEYNTHMLFASYFVLNCIERLEIAPFVHGFSGHRRAEDQLRRVLVPDVDPGTLPSGAFAQSMGNFFESYRKLEPQNVVVTCFFLDAVPDILETIKAITDSTLTGAIWVNFGPLLWHYEHLQADPEAPEAPAGGLEVDLETLLGLIEKHGWVIETQSTHKTTYCGNRRGMMVYEYMCEFFVAKRVI